MSTYLKQLKKQDLVKADPWPEDATLYQPYEMEQILLPEQASCLAVKAYLKMRNLKFDVQYRSNAEFMSPGGRMSKLPVLRVGAFILSEFEPIVTFTEQKEGFMNNLLNEDERADMHSYLSLAENIFSMAEYWISFINDKVYKEVTAPRNGCAFPWPLKALQNYRKRSNVLRLLRVYEWDVMNIDDVIEKVNKCCDTLSPKLEESNNFFYGDQPCELDAIVFGHLFAILTTPLPNMALAQTVQNHQTLVNFCKRMEQKYFQTRTLDLN